MAVHVKNEPRLDYTLEAYNQKDSDDWSGNNYYYKATPIITSESDSDQSSESQSDQTSESESNP